MCDWQTENTIERRFCGRCSGDRARGQKKKEEGLLLLAAGALALAVTVTGLSLAGAGVRDSAKRETPRGVADSTADN